MPRGDGVDKGTGFGSRVGYICLSIESLFSYMLVPEG